jgi:hypothetical protein
LSSRAASKVESQRNAAINTETNRQEELQKRAQATLLQNTKKFTPENVNQGIQAAEDARTERLQANVTGGNTLADVNFSPSAPKIVMEDAARRVNEGLASGKEFAGQLAGLGAFGEQQFGTRLDLSRLAESMGQFGTESRNSGAILPLELNKANRAGDSLSGIADITGALGSLANFGSAVGANPFGPVPGSTGLNSGVFQSGPR